MNMTEIEVGRVNALWLESGKKLVVDQCVVFRGSFFVRSGAKTVLIVPGNKVQSVETEYASEAEVDAIFAGEGNR